jgi:hypothetical protein
MTASRQLVGGGQPIFPPLIKGKDNKANSSVKPVPATKKQKTKKWEKRTKKREKE